MTKLHFITASGRSFSLNSRQYRKIGWALHDGQVAEGRLRSGQKQTPYQRYRAKRLGGPASTGPADYAITTCRASLKEMDRLGGSSFAQLDGVILALAERPTPRGCLQLKWLLPELRIVRGAECVVVYAIDEERKQVHILKVTFWGKQILKKSKSETSKRLQTKVHSPIDVDWQDVYSGQTVEELLSFEKFGRTDLLVQSFEQAIQKKADRGRRLSDVEMVVLAVRKLDTAMVMDDFDNFFRYSPQFASTIVDSLLRVGCKRLARATQRAVDVLDLDSLKTRQVKAAMNRPDALRDEKLSECSNSYWRAPGPAHRLFAFIKANKRSIRF
jgi:hypothetical protein